jgi:hypothetical protein
LNKKTAERAQNKIVLLSFDDLLVIKVDFLNPTNEVKEILAPRFSLQIGESWATSIRLSSYCLLNETDSYRVILQPGESKEAFLPFLVSCPSLSKEHWERYLELDYTLIIDLYPIKQVISLDIQ